MALQILRQIGLTEGEIKVYVALLEIGEATKTALAKRSGIAPSNIYDVTNRLLEKGIISRVEKNGVAHFHAAHPRFLLDFLDAKEQEIEKEKHIVQEALPSLLGMFQKTKEKITIEVFQGWNGLKTVFQDLLDECGKGDENFIFGASRGEDDKQANRFFLKYSKLREQKGILTSIIFNAELMKEARINFFLKAKHYRIRFLQQSTPAEIMLYKNRTCIIILTKEPLVIRISGQEVMKSFKQYFDVLWGSAHH